ncbi:hypothetical protein ZWY2020_025753 [Hordeum vulgare]|nr:hypothetical protein ZWY2020_025753 [Hordeum vulgare]
MEVGDEEFTVGVVISVKTTLGKESQEGVGRADRGERRNVRVLKANYIQEFSVIGKYDDPLDPAGCVLDLAAIHAREKAPSVVTLSKAMIISIGITSKRSRPILSTSTTITPHMDAHWSAPSSSSCVGPREVARLLCRPSIPPPRSGRHARVYRRHPSQLRNNEFETPKNHINQSPRTKEKTR